MKRADRISHAINAIVGSLIMFIVCLTASVLIPIPRVKLVYGLLAAGWVAAILFAVRVLKRDEDDP